MYYFEGKNSAKQFQVKSGNLLSDITDVANYMILLKK